MSVTTIKLTRWDAGIQTPEPFRGTQHAAAIDFHSPPNWEPRYIEPGLPLVIPLNYAVQIPHGHYGQLAIRSSLALRGLMLLGGVIDSDYRGEVRAIVVNSSTVPFLLEPGSRFCQMIVVQISEAGLEFVTHRNQLTDTGRAGGFGSTGK